MFAVKFTSNLWPMITSKGQGLEARTAGLHDVIALRKWSFRSGKSAVNKARLNEELSTFLFSFR